MNVVFYKPFKYAYQERNYARKCRFSHELQMLGDNTLTELRDLIVCTSDKGLQQEVDSPSADVSHLLNAKVVQYETNFIDWLVGNLHILFCRKNILLVVFSSKEYFIMI